jgi:sugar lactone lactonase YvrE
MKSIAGWTSLISLAAMLASSARADTLFVSNRETATIRKITAAGEVTTFATVDYFPFGMVVNRNGDLLVASSQLTNKINRITPDGVVSRLLSLPRVFDATGLALSRAGNLYVCSQGGYSLTRVVGSSAVAYAPGFVLPFGMAFDEAEFLFVADLNNNRISKVAPNQTVSTVALNVPQCYGLAFDSAGNLYASSETRIFKFTPGGDKTTFANGFNNPFGIVFDSAGDLYVADYGNSAIKRVSPDGTVHPFANVPFPQFIAIKPDVTQPSLSISAAGSLKVRGGINLSYVTLKSPDLANWTPIQTNRITASSAFDVVEESAETQDASFYKARLYP